MAEEELLFDKEMLSTISDIKVKLKSKKEYLTRWEDRLMEWETNLKVRENRINDQMAVLNDEINKVVGKTKKAKK